VSCKHDAHSSAVKQIGQVRKLFIVTYRLPFTGVDCLGL